MFGAEVEKREGNDGTASVWSARFPWDAEGRNYKETMPFDHFMQINWNIPEPRPGISSMPDGLKACERNIVDDILRASRARSRRGEEDCPGDDAAVHPQGVHGGGNFRSESHVK